MKWKIEALRPAKKELQPRGNLRLFKLEKPVTPFWAARKVEVTSVKVSLNLHTGELLSDHAYGPLLARQQST